jgi:hypothetical protein
MQASSGVNWAPLADWRVTNCIDDGAGNRDPHYGWRSDGVSLIDSSGHVDDAPSSTRTIAASFHLTL